MTSFPILYSFRRCPYAIRARLALAAAQQKVELREVVLKDKPVELTAISSKSTVPVLQLVDGTVIDESRNIMLWALQQNDPAGLLPTLSVHCDTDLMLDENDFEFKHWLDRYKYSDRYPDHNGTFYRTRAELFLQKLELRLQHSQYLSGSQPSLADIGIMPFVRQFSLVDRAWFEQSHYVHLRRWLTTWLDSELFDSVMSKYPQWRATDAQRIFFPQGLQR